MECGCLTNNHFLKPKQCMPKQTTYHIRRVLEYSEFFKDASPIDIPATLKLYSRNTSSAIVGNDLLSDGIGSCGCSSTSEAAEPITSSERQESESVAGS